MLRKIRNGAAVAFGWAWRLALVLLAISVVVDLVTDEGDGAASCFDRRTNRPAAEGGCQGRTDEALDVCLEVAFEACQR